LTEWKSHGSNTAGQLRMFLSARAGMITHRRLDKNESLCDCEMCASSPNSISPSAKKKKKIYFTNLIVFHHCPRLPAMNTKVTKMCFQLRHPCPFTAYFSMCVCNRLAKHKSVQSLKVQACWSKPLQLCF